MEFTLEEYPEVKANTEFVIEICTCEIKSIVAVESLAFGDPSMYEIFTGETSLDMKNYVFFPLCNYTEDWNFTVSVTPALDDSETPFFSQEASS